jgi:hypothetical protein
MLEPQVIEVARNIYGDQWIASRERILYQDRNAPDKEDQKYKRGFSPMRAYQW